MMNEVISELDKHPEISPEMRDKILAETPSMIDEAAAEADKVSEPAKEEPSDKSKPMDSKQTSFSWDTTTAPDGVYMLKAIVSDKLSNPTDALTGESAVKQVTICNKAPYLVAFKKTLTILPDKRVRVEGVSYQKIVPIAGVQYRVDAGEWAAAAAKDGVYASAFEAFTISTDPLTAGDHTLEIKAIDQAGNSATTQVKATVK